MQQILLYFLLLCGHLVGAIPKSFDLYGVFNSPLGGSYYPAVDFALQDINNSSEILPTTHVNLQMVLSSKTPDVIAQMIDLKEQKQISLLAGNEYSSIAKVSGVVGTVYEIAQVSGLAIISDLSNKQTYPYFTRTIAPSGYQVFAIRDTLSYYADLAGLGWSDIALISETASFSLDLAQILIDNLLESQSIVTFQTFLEDAKSFDVELREIQKSGARVIVMFMYNYNFPDFLRASNEYGLIGDNYVWFTSSPQVGDSDFPFHDEDVRRLAHGMLGTFTYLPRSGAAYDNLIERWPDVDPIVYPNAGAAPIIRAGLLDDGMPPVHASVWTENLLHVAFEGVTGPVSLNERGDREQLYGIYFYNFDQNEWILSDIRSVNGIEHVEDIIWHSNSTKLPDLDIRSPFYYWSCHDGKEYYDATGKTVTLHTPDGSDVDEISEGYQCDNFIDCRNFSDESNDCVSNYMILFIVFGIITGLLMLIVLLVLAFVVIFGIILRFRLLRIYSPVFLVIILISMFVGYGSIFAWFGKPHPVACGFQPWLLGLSAISMISALCAKTFRIWRIFRSEFKRQKITDFELLVLWFLFLLPAIIVLIIWTIVSTPTASMEERNGVEHYVCTTGGFTGFPGGYVFFAIFVGYSTVILLIGVALSILTRNVPSLFNESKLLAISIYNLGFLSIVIIPVFLVVQPFNPFVAWILRTCAILYALTATLCLQFVSPLFRIIVLDKFENKDIAVTALSDKTDTKK